MLPNCQCTSSHVVARRRHNRIEHKNNNKKPNRNTQNEQHNCQCTNCITPLAPMRECAGSQAPLAPKTVHASKWMKTDNYQYVYIYIILYFASVFFLFCMFFSCIVAAWTLLFYGFFFVLFAVAFFPLRCVFCVSLPPYRYIHGVHGTINRFFIFTTPLLTCMLIGNACKIQSSTMNTALMLQDTLLDGWMLSRSNEHDVQQQQMDGNGTQLFKLEQPESVHRQAIISFECGSSSSREQRPGTWETNHTDNIT